MPNQKRAKETGTRIASDLVRQRRISVWVSAGEHDTLQKAAEGAGLSLSSYVRAAALAIARVQSKRGGGVPWE